MMPGGLRTGSGSVRQMDADWPVAEAIEAGRLTLEPLRVDHAPEMAVTLADARLHEFIGGDPATEAQLRQRYTVQVAGRSPDGTQGWLNWIARDRATGQAVGTVQATIYLDGDRPVAEVAWVVGAGHQRQGYATEAATAMAAWLRGHGTEVLIAHVHPDHHASARVCVRLGMAATDLLVDGETRWTTPMPEG
ncbi:MAG: hypothetical protein V7637_5712 [Mycobacteriales bacterium]|jgi:RimJ/RimL family protein N-acetyltransferase